MDAPTITDAALETLTETGLDGLTMRAVAQRLGVRVGGLYYHLPGKAALLRAMGDRVCREALTAFDDGGMRDAHALCTALRAQLLSRRDGARLLAAAPLAGSVGAFALMERLLELLDGTVGPAVANLAGDALLSYTTGFVLQEQLRAEIMMLADADAAAALAHFPRTARGLDVDDDTAFAAALTAIVHGFTT